MRKWRHPRRRSIRRGSIRQGSIRQGFRGTTCGKPSAGQAQFVAPGSFPIASAHRPARPNGRPRAAFGVVHCARNCIQCNPLSSPRYTPADSLIPLTGGRFDSRIPRVRQSVRARAGFVRVDGSQLVVRSPLNIRASRFPPRPAPTINRQV